MSSNRYPHEADLEKLAKTQHTFEVAPLRAWFEFARSLWEYLPEYWPESEPGAVFVKVSTGGWSGNEDIIAAMQKNYIFWGRIFFCMRRGGHYTFVAPGADKEFGIKPCRECSEPTKEPK